MHTATRRGVHVHDIKQSVMQYGSAACSRQVLCRLQGQKNPPLNGLGKAQAQALAARLSSTDKWDAIYSSDLDRTAQTAEAISNALNPEETTCSGQVTLRPAFRERCLGVLEVRHHLHLASLCLLDERDEASAQLNQIITLCTGHKSRKIARIFIAI